MNVAPGEKFGAFFLSRCRVDPDVPQEQEIEPGVWVSRRLGVDIADHWREWLGSLRIKEMGAEGLAMYVTATSANPAVIDADSHAVYRRARGLLSGLLLQGVPWNQGPLQGAFLVHGANIDGTLRLKAWDHVAPQYQTVGLDFTVRLAGVHRAHALADRIRGIESALPADWMRFHRGLGALLLANEATNVVGDRVHQLVRVLESVIKPRIGNSMKDFAHRGRTLATDDQPTRQVLLELYDLRSHVEHLNVPTDRLPPGGTDEERRELVNRRTRQADVLARAVLLRILETPNLLEEFRTDDKIDAFWRMSDGDRIRLWGNRLDIAGIP